MSVIEKSFGRLGIKNIILDTKHALKVRTDEGQCGYDIDLWIPKAVILKYELFRKNNGPRMLLIEQGWLKMVGLVY